MTRLQATQPRTGAAWTLAFLISFLATFPPALQSEPAPLAHLKTKQQRASSPAPVLCRSLLSAATLCGGLSTLVLVPFHTSFIPQMAPLLRHQICSCRGQRYPVCWPPLLSLPFPAKGVSSLSFQDIPHLGLFSFLGLASSWPTSPGLCLPGHTCAPGRLRLSACLP